MARPRKAPAKATQAAALIEALNFISVAADNDVTLGMTAKHVRLSGNMAIAYDGQLAAGHPIVEELTLCPQLTLLTKALARSGKSLVISETDAGRLSIKGEGMRAVVPCLPADDMPDVYPDPAIAPVDDRIKAAFKCCGTLASENGQRVVEASLLLRQNDCTGTNGAAILQFWHGIDLPPMGMVLPKVFCAAVAAVKAPVVGFGCSWSGPAKVASVTFHFEGGAWLKSQCYADDWPPLDQLWQVPNYADVPKGLFEALVSAADFNEKGFVTLASNAVQSHASAEIGAQFEVKGVQGGKGFAGKLMAQVSPWCSQIDLTTYPDRAFFVGGEAATPVRGIVMGVIERTAEVAEPPPPAQQPEQTPAADGGWSSPTTAAEQQIEQAHNASDDWASPGYTGQGDGWSSPAVDTDIPMPE